MASLLRFLVLALALLAVPAQAEKRIAISFDDVPRHAGGFKTPDERAIALIAALAEAGVEQAGFFVTTGNLEQPDGKGGEARIRAYAAAGHAIGAVDDGLELAVTQLAGVADHAHVKLGVDAERIIERASAGQERGEDGVELIERVGAIGAEALLRALDQGLALPETLELQGVETTAEGLALRWSDGHLGQLPLERLSAATTR